MKGFLMHHNPHGRRTFVDELYVHPNHRRLHVATSLFAAIARGPIELIVAQQNVKAISLYAKLGFCATDRGVYTPRAHELCMATTSFKRTRDKIAAAAPRPHPTELYTWRTLPQPLRDEMVRALRAEWNLTATAAKRRLRTTDATIRYTVVR